MIRFRVMSLSGVANGIKRRRWIFPEGSKTLISLAILVGLLAGAANIIFRTLIDAVQEYAFNYDTAVNLAEVELAWWRKLIMPAIGALLSAPLVLWFAAEAKGHGVPSVIEALLMRGGRMRYRVAAAKTFASALCIGTGGSAGREGPIIQIGGAIGSMLGQMTRLSKANLRTIVAAGAAAGISATFNAPIAGVLFAAEVLLNGRTVNLFPILIGSVTGGVVSRAFYGPHPSFSIPSDIHFGNVYDYGFFLLLGICAGVLSILFMRLLEKTEIFFEKLNFPPFAKFAIGGLLVGLIAIKYPHVLGSNYHTVETALGLHGEYVPSLFVLFASLAFLKMLATTVTLGSGGSGGLFAPTLFMGATFGAGYGLLVNKIAPGVSSDIGVYALVCMAAMVAGCIRAPMTAIVIIFEMTDSYEFILPLMAAVATSVLVSSRFEVESVYTKRLVEKGLKAHLSPDSGLLEQLSVGDAMRVNVPTIRRNMQVYDAVSTMREANLDDIPVVDSNDNFIGFVSLDDIREILFEEDLAHTLLADDVMVRPPVRVTPDTTLLDGMLIMEKNHLHALPVTDEETQSKLVGVLKSDDILRAYEHAILPSRDT